MLATCVVDDVGVVGGSVDSVVYFVVYGRVGVVLGAGYATVGDIAVVVEVGCSCWFA